jgi:hypothetical protein
MGDINPTIPFNNPLLAGGALLRYNLNPRYVIKGSVTYVPLSATDVGSDDYYRLRRAASFSNNIMDFATQFEFNFLPYKFDEKKISFSPFLSTGIGCANLMGGNVGENFWVTLPFGAGIKFTFGKFWSAGWEWNFRKLFSDNFDGVENVGAADYSSIYHNNDWYSYSGIFLSYKLFNVNGTCPAYEEQW